MINLEKLIEEADYTSHFYGSSSHQAISKISNALRAIVELHSPKMYEGRVSNYLICTGCYEEEGQNYDYPCPTIQAIEKELR